MLHQELLEASVHYRLVDNYWIKTICHPRKSTNSLVVVNDEYLIDFPLNLQRLRAFVPREALCHRLGMFICGMFLKTRNTRHSLLKLARRDSLNHLRRRTGSKQLLRTLDQWWSTETGRQSSQNPVCMLNRLWIWRLRWLSSDFCHLCCQTCRHCAHVSVQLLRPGYRRCWSEKEDSVVWRWMHVAHVETDTASGGRWRKCNK